MLSDKSKMQRKALRNSDWREVNCQNSKDDKFPPETGDWRVEKSKTKTIILTAANQTMLSGSVNQTHPL
ncbi:hypothetical protein RvY_01034 [Ramazzottius varieornatus]|uniref:Uncharacterized protein n=1 Tax=Ramazzottius varieornatus TaxID=947166 RepID=A0A1D1UEU7_RAMVA|nr:hypothetical protein RvY_01034 [Ramazzottius varieornatus]